LVVLIAAVPLMLLSTTIALQNYRMALDATADTAARLREAALARHVLAIASARQMMQALSQLPELTEGSPDACHARLLNTLGLLANRYTNLSVADARGITRCSGLTVPNPGIFNVGRVRNAALYKQARDRRDLVLGPIRASLLTGQDVIPIVYPIIRSGNLAGYLYAGMRLDWFSQSAQPPVPDLKAIWLADGRGHITLVSTAGAHALPPPDILKQLQSGSDILGGTSQGGQPYAYASAVLGDGYSLIVAYPATLDRAAARGLLVRRIGQLGILLLLGLAAVAIGVHLALVEPLTRLSHAVVLWRSTGDFDTATQRAGPTELRALAASFGDAIGSIAEHADRHRVAVGQQELLMKEIHHRVKNNLQIVASLLNLQASRIRLPEARAEFASARDRVRALATLHRHLYLQGEVHTINMPVFLTELCDQLFQAMGETAGRRIKLNIVATPLQMTSDQAVPLSLIVTEAVSNALKYAFPGDRTGHVNVRLTSDGDAADLVIEDNGIGMPAGRADTETGPRDGIGITLIRGFARQLGATLTVREDEGTHYSLHIPLHRETESADLAA
jgi:two-component sensor histidine kinase